MARAFCLCPRSHSFRLGRFPHSPTPRLHWLVSLPSQCLCNLLQQERQRRWISNGVADAVAAHCTPEVNLSLTGGMGSRLTTIWRSCHGWRTLAIGPPALRPLAPAVAGYRCGRVLQRRAALSAGCLPVLPPGAAVRGGCHRGLVLPALRPAAADAAAGRCHHSRRWLPPNLAGASIGCRCHLLPPQLAAVASACLHRWPCVATAETQRCHRRCQTELRP